MRFRATGIITEDGQRAERTLTLSPPPGKGIAYALTYAVAIFNDLTDDGTTHQGVWCYFEGEPCDEQESFSARAGA